MGGELRLEDMSILSPLVGNLWNIHNFLSCYHLNLFLGHNMVDSTRTGMLLATFCSRGCVGYLVELGLSFEDGNNLTKRIIFGPLY